MVAPLEPGRDYPENIAPLMHTALADWIKEHPTIRVRAALPITQDGQTVAIHLWYDKPDWSA